jgi:histidine ammonia-lyase
MRKRFYTFLGLLMLLLLPLSAIEKDELLLTGKNLRIEDLVHISKEAVQVEIDPAAMARVRRSHAVVLQAASEGHAIYGLNRGINLNKDKVVFSGDALAPEEREASELFNRNLLFSHNLGIAPELSAQLVFPLMLVRLNTLLIGNSGAQPEMVLLLQEMINKRIQPLIPSRGSVGEADITILSSLGLVMMGEGEVMFEGQRMRSKEAFALAGIDPLVFFGKDALALVSSNAYSAAYAALALHETEELLKKADLIFALSLEGLNGNIAPFLKDVQGLRPFPGQMQTADNVLRALKGSYLLDLSETRELQDPLSFRSFSQVHGTARDLFERAKANLLVQINSSDDNPAAIPDIRPHPSASAQERAYYLSQGGAVIPSANFEPINWVLDFEALANALKHISKLSTQRSLKLANEKFTKLTRFLAPNPTTFAYSTIQKTFASLDTENTLLSEPVSSDFTPLGAELEDHATNAPLVISRFCKLLENLRYIFGMELMHAAQAVDLRKQQNPELKLGCLTNAEYEVFRASVSFLEEDRPLNEDIRKSYDFLTYQWSNRILQPDCLKTT